MKYFYILTAETPWGDKYTVKGFTKAADVSAVLNAATYEFIEKASILSGVASHTIGADLQILFFNFWESPEQGLGGK